jgi:hypothetical protein
MLWAVYSKAAYRQVTVPGLRLVARREFRFGENWLSLTSLPKFPGGIAQVPDMWKLSSLNLESFLVSLFSHIGRIAGHDQECIIIAPV